MQRFLLATSLALLAFAAWALPSIDAVQAEVGKGHYAQAEDMMREVLAAKPGSARAHYVYAEILAHDRRFDRAADEAAQARRLDPSLQFTQPEKFNAFTRLLEREQGTARHAASVERLAPPALREPARAPSSGGVPGWLWGVGAVALALIAWRALSAGRQATAPGNLSGNGFGTPSPAPYGPGYAPAPAPASGSLLGTGLAVAGGVAAGVLAEKLFEEHREAARSPALPGLIDDPLPADTAARDLEQRPIDFGSGDGWGGSDSDGPSASDNDGW